MQMYYNNLEQHNIIINIPCLNFIVKDTLSRSYHKKIGFLIYTRSVLVNFT